MIRRTFSKHRRRREVLYFYFSQLRTNSNNLKNPKTEMSYNTRNCGEVIALPPTPTHTFHSSCYMDQGKIPPFSPLPFPGGLPAPFPQKIAPLTPVGTSVPPFRPQLPLPSLSAVMPPSALPGPTTTTTITPPVTTTTTTLAPPTPIATTTTPTPPNQNLNFLSILAAAAIEDKNEKTYEGRQLVVRLVSSPPSNELVARKTIKFSVMMTGDDANLPGSLYLAAVLVEAKTGKTISAGLMEKKVKLKRDPASRPPQDAILQRIVPYRETGIEFQIVKGSAKKNIQNQVKFELRLYKGPVGAKNYEVVDTDFSASYRILTHSSQLGRTSA